MFKSKEKRWIICICVVLFFLCSFIGTSSILSVSAEESVSKQTQVYEDERLLESISFSPMPLSESSNKSEYVNLGSSLLSEGERGLSQLHYIENANYFLANPEHHKNTRNDHQFGTCTTVAHQILLGYHNYYSDRRLIPEISSDGERYLSENYGDLNLDPLFVYNPVGTYLGVKILEHQMRCFTGYLTKRVALIC